MKYLCLVYLEVDKRLSVPDANYMNCGGGSRQSVRVVAAEALQPIAAASVGMRTRRALILIDRP